MTGVLLQLAAGFARTWTAVYTWRLPPEIAHERRREIASDLAECQRDSSQNDAALAAQIVSRVLLGVPDDLGWRWTDASDGRPTAAYAVMFAAVAIFVAWAALLGSPRQLPAVAPPTPWQGGWVRAPLPPPPPPPLPPCPPGAIDPNPVGCEK